MSLDRIPNHPPTIKAVASQAARPLFSVMIPTYNCIEYLEATLRAVLGDDKGAQYMQIEVIDDCSTDGNVEELVSNVGKGRIDFFRQPQNVGSLRNFETCLQRSTGELVHLLHGDDLVKPGYYAEIQGLFTAYPSIGAAFTSFSTINETGAAMYENLPIQPGRGIISNWLEKIASNQLLRTSVVVVRRSVYEELGSFYAVNYGEDWEMFVRIAARFPVAYSPQNLASYRLHTNNISTRSLAKAQNVKDLRTVMQIIQGYLPAEKRKRIKQASAKNFARYFASNAQAIYRQSGDGKAAISQARAAVGLYLSKGTVLSLLRVCLKVLLKYRR